MDSLEDPAQHTGLLLRQEAIRVLNGVGVSDAIRSLRAGAAGLVLDGALPARAAQAVFRDMERDGGWAEECWMLQDDNAVHLVSASEFEAGTETRRFSRNECLRKPSATAWSLRGLLSGMASDQAREALSRAFGEVLTFRSADIARYRCGDYLRRHSDTFEGRRIGLVWFVGSGWSVGMGGELIVEGPTGCTQVVPPQCGSLGILALRPECHHQVAMVRSTSWTRYSIAAHYSLSNHTDS